MKAAEHARRARMAANAETLMRDIGGEHREALRRAGMACWKRRHPECDLNAITVKLTSINDDFAGFRIIDPVNQSREGASWMWSEMDEAMAEEGMVTEGSPIVEAE